MSEITRICNDCGEEKPLSAFHRDKAGKHGRRATCAKCVLAYKHGRPRPRRRTKTSADNQYHHLNRINDRINKDPETGCWNWQGYKDKKGYGQVGYDGIVVYTHRLIFEHHKGPIPEGMVTDHLCRNPACCNPDHLESVTRGENVLRGEGFAAKNKAKTHCPAGHALSGANLEVDKKGWRRCRECRLENRRKQRARS